MSVSRTRVLTRSPQACERCRRSKTKCTGDRPQCRSCIKRKVSCSWARLAAPDTFSALTPPRHQESPTRADHDLRSQSDSVIPGGLVLAESNAVLPPARQRQRLFDIFLARHHEVEFCSFFHKPSLDISTLSEQSPFLVLSVNSLASLFVISDEVKADFGHQTAFALSEHFACLAKVESHGVIDEPSIHNIQAHLILALREHLVWSNIKAYMYAGTAIRMAQVLNLNLEGSQRLSSREKEVRRRTFWACFVIDRLTSYSCNKPFTISFLSAQVRLPCLDNVFAFDEISTSPWINDLPNHVSQVAQIGLAPFFVSAVHLWGDMALLHVSGGRRRLNYGPNDPMGEFNQCTKAIEEFTGTLSPTLEWSAQNLRLHQVTGQTQMYINICFMVQHSKCLMNQEYLPQLDSQYTYSSDMDYVTSNHDGAGISLDHIDNKIIKTCIASISVITDMALTLSSGSSRDRELLQSTFAANAILTAAAVHLWVLYTQTCDECPKDEALAKAESLRQIIKSWQLQWKVAAAWVETLDMLYKLYVYSYGKIVESELDCWDIGFDDINVVNHSAEEEIIDSESHQIRTGGDDVSDPAVAYRRLYDKVRSILVNPLLPTDVKKRNLRTYSRSLWQHMWAFGPTEDFGSNLLSVEPILGLSYSEIFTPNFELGGSI